jgi:DDE superfamily endonuclease
MEDVLEVYKRPYDERFPQICMDESGKQLITDKLEGIPMQPGQPARYDYSYEQGPMLNLFLACEPLAGKRMVKVSEQKTSKDWAHFMQEVIDVHYPHAEKILLVMDNLSTHSPAAFYHAFPPAEARRLAAKLEIHHTPRHGSWLNMAEIEFAALARQCLSRRIATREELEHQVAYWQEQRNTAATTVNWRFTTADARIKLKRLYPSLKATTTDSEPENVAKEV